MQYIHQYVYFAAKTVLIDVANVIGVHPELDEICVVGPFPRRASLSSKVPLAILMVTIGVSMSYHLRNKYTTLTVPFAPLMASRSGVLKSLRTIPETRLREIL